ncbi:hypothetical protein BDV23DRAFT_180747 [Aspergillus alliaceus]|uniref:Peptidase S1 domain-containing protein n=1 Tax=Petromyces alliaceus TaxID=209559 RepID=A0A5N7CI37_PETAA|nr:hypothetical protein BDV23DRAFT_180747 [Aspergillus alliaceus]
MDPHPSSDSVSFHPYGTLFDVDGWTDSDLKGLFHDDWDNVKMAIGSLDRAISFVAGLTVETSIRVWDAKSKIIWIWHREHSTKSVEPILKQDDSDDQELRFEKCPRREVADTGFAPNGKYSGVCKLIMRFQNEEAKRFGGLGWLLDKETVVTAGHCLYKKKLGRVPVIEAIVRYGIGASTNESRMATRAALHRGYFARYHPPPGSSVIKLDKPSKDNLQMNQGVPNSHHGFSLPAFQKALLVPENEAGIEMRNAPKGVPCGAREVIYY